MMLLGLLKILALYVGGLPACAQTTGATQLLSRGPGAEAAALAGSNLSTVHDPTALYWNPAGLAGAGGMVTGEHLFLYDGARYDFIGLSVPSKLATFGLGALQLNRDGIVARQAIDDPGYKVSNTQSVYLLSAARPLTEHWSAGATANVLDFNVAGYKDKGFGFDAGAQGAYPQDELFGFKKAVWSFGAAIKNLVEPKITLLSDTESFPRELRGGAALSFQTASRPTDNGLVRHDRATVLVSARRVSGEPALHPALGLSYSFEDLLVFRLGFDGALSAGMGLHTMDGRFVIDYALEDRPLAYNHRFSISYRFLQPTGKKLETYSEEVDEDYLRSKEQADGLARESFTAGQGLFKDQRYAEARDAFRLAALLAPGQADYALWSRRAAEAYRRSEIARLSDASQEPGQEEDAYKNTLRLLDLGADDAARLAARAEHFGAALPAERLAALSSAGFDTRVETARRLTRLGRLSEAQSVEGTLAVLSSSQTAPALAAAKADTEARAADVRRSLASAEPGSAPAARAALAVLTAFPDDEAAARALADYRREHPLSIKERFYALKLYYLAAVKFAKRTGDDLRSAADLLGEVLRRDPANEDAATLWNAMAAEGQAQ